MGNGIFSVSLQALQLQLSSLLDGVGGERTMKLLDSLSQLGEGERDVVLHVLQTTLDKILGGDKRLVTAKDVEEATFVDSLYQDIVASFERLPLTKEKASRLSVVDGGRTRKKTARTIDLNTVRQQRSSLRTPIV